jgi:hypothetical protein
MIYAIWLWPYSGPPVELSFKAASFGSKKTTFGGYDGGRTFVAPIETRIFLWLCDAAVNLMELETRLTNTWPILLRSAMT